VVVPLFRRNYLNLLEENAAIGKLYAIYDVNDIDVLTALIVKERAN